MANRSNKRRRICSSDEDEQNNGYQQTEGREKRKRVIRKARNAAKLASTYKETNDDDSFMESSELDEDYYDIGGEEQKHHHQYTLRKRYQRFRYSPNGFDNQYEGRRRSERQLFKQLGAKDRNTSRTSMLEPRKSHDDCLEPNQEQQEEAHHSESHSRYPTRRIRQHEQPMMNGTRKVVKDELEEELNKKEVNDEELKEGGGDAEWKGSSEESSREEHQLDDEYEIEEDAARTDVGEETDAFNGARRYPMRSKRAQQRPQLRRSHRKRRELFGSAALQLHRPPPNPALDLRRKGPGRPRHRRRKLDRCSSSSSSSGSSTSTLSELGMHTMRKDLHQEEKFERRKLKSMLKRRTDLMPINITKKEEESSLLNIAREKLRQQNRRSSCADIDPMSIDYTAGFDQIGGLGCHIRQLKEMCLFPMLYPHIFQHFSIQPPKGVLFYGPPGTGKTLVARALANECGRTTAASVEGQIQQRHRVAFFMRNGADCLSKWVGESERQLRLLFDQAYRMRPSIIFFDEIDGLAPVRSSRQDQIHASIVSTLLALMDGVDSRGEVIVIGATNRLDSIDPALRRPGRFDRELRFDLPDATARKQILAIHTRDWPTENHPQPKMLDWLAGQTSGYCGADLKALCTEAVLISLRKRYPHMYLSAEKLLLEPSQIRVEFADFEAALRLIVPASRREGALFAATPSNKHSMSKLINPIIDELVAERVPLGYQRRNDDLNFNSGPNELERVVMSLRPKPAVPAARLLLHGPGCLGQGTHFLPALLARLDHLPMFTISCERVFSGGVGGLPEEQIAQTIRRALRAIGQRSPVLLAMPDLDLLERTLPTTSWKMLISSLNSFTGSTSALILAAVQCHYDELSTDLKQAFRPHHVYELGFPKQEIIRPYFEAIMEAAREQPHQFKSENYPEPPKAPPDDPKPVRHISKKEYAELEKMYQHMLRQFRIFLRDLLRQLIRDSRFKTFHLPVDPKDVEDYYEIVKNPMSLSTMMYNIDNCKYDNAEAFLNDIRLIRDNAIEYNPDIEIEDIQIKHTGKWLVEVAEAMFDKEMDDDFPKKLEEARLLVEEGKRNLNIVNNNQESSDQKEQQETNNLTIDNQTDIAVNLAIIDHEEVVTQEEAAGPSCPSPEHIMREPPCSDETDRTIMPEKEGYSPNISDSPTKQSENEGSSPQLCNEIEGTMEAEKDRQGEVGEISPPFIYDEEALRAAVDQAVDKAHNSSWSVPDIECLGAQLELIISQYCHQWDRSGLPKQLCQCIEAFKL